MTPSQDTTSHDRGPRRALHGRLDLELVAGIVRRAGLDCQVDGAPSSAVLRARKAARAPAPWTVVAGLCTDHPAGSLAFVGPTHCTRTRLLRDPDERRLAALVVLQGLREDPHELLTHDEASASGLADGLVWV